VEPQSSADKLAKVTYLFGETEPAGRVPAEPVYRDPHETDDDFEEAPSYDSPPTGSQFDRDNAELYAEFDRIEKISMAALTRKNMSADEMYSLLIEHDVVPHTARAEVERLECVGLLGDVAMAIDLVGRLMERKGLGKSAIEAELRKRGIGAIEIADALGQYEFEPDDELERAEQVALKRAPQLKSLTYQVAERRLIGFLMRKGYSGSVSRSAAETALVIEPPTPSGSVRFR
jgi:SOS response regulatory protein OraA/RecX